MSKILKNQRPQIVKTLDSLHKHLSKSITKTEKLMKMVRYEMKYDENATFTNKKIS